MNSNKLKESVGDGVKFSVFDSTDTSKIKERIGGHQSVPAKTFDDKAFSFQRTTTRIDPHKFTKKLTGNGGTMVIKPFKKVSVPEAAQIALANKIPRILRNPAICPRPNPKNTELRRYYERGDLPLQIDHSSVGNRLAWKVEIQKLDFHHYLPIFFDGLREVDHPYAFIAEQGILDMLDAAPFKVLPVVPQLIIPLKNAINVRIKEIVSKTLRIIQVLVNCDISISGGAGLVGQALVPYYRQLLPVFNIFINNNENIGDKIMYSQRKALNMGDLVIQTLEQMEIRGGDDAFINIKYLIPTYQSAVIY